MQAQKTGRSLTRRTLLKTAGVLCVESIIGLPKEAYALNDSKYDSDLTAAELWANAVKEASENGEPVICVDPSLAPQVENESDIAKSGYTTGAASKFYYGQLVTATATYKLVGSNPVKIGYVQRTSLTISSSTISNLYMSYTKIDGGRTLAVYYVCDLKLFNIFNIQFEEYAEFYASGGSYIQ